MNRPTSLIFDSGIGDFYQLESFWSPGDRAALRAIHYPFQCRASLAMRATLEANPVYAHLAHRTLEYPTQAVEGSTTPLRDNATLPHRAFRGSSFLANKLACDLPPGLPDRFVFVHGATPFNSASIRLHRDLAGDEWPALIARLEARDQVGLLVNSPGTNHPRHPRLVDAAGWFTMPQAIEALKLAEGYAGIDSCFAILAAQLFGPDDLLIRTRNPWVVSQAWWHYPPHETFPFLVPEVGGPPHPAAPKPEPGELVELRCNALHAGRNFGGGDRLDLPPELAAEYLADGRAVRVGP